MTTPAEVIREALVFGHPVDRYPQSSWCVACRDYVPGTGICPTLADELAALSELKAERNRLLAAVAWLLDSRPYPTTECWANAQAAFDALSPTTPGGEVSARMGTCVICEWRDTYARGRCRSCYVFERKHGYDKPEDYLVREGEKELERRMLERNRFNGYALR